MPRIGSAAIPDLAQYRVGNVEQQQGQRYTMPERGEITELGAYIRGVAGNGAVDYRLVLWAWGGSVGAGNAILGQTATHSASSGTVAPGSLVQQTWPLITPVELDAGYAFMVGIATETSGSAAHQWGLRSGGGTHYAKDLGGGTSWPVSMKNCYSDAHDMAAWIESYTALAAAWVRRSGAWIRASDVFDRRSGAWAKATDVQVRRSGAWNDAS